MCFTRATDWDIEVARSRTAWPVKMMVAFGARMFPNKQWLGTSYDPSLWQHFNGIVDISSHLQIVHGVGHFTVYPGSCPLMGAAAI